MSADENAALAAQALPCVCGHAEHEHAWNAQASPHITMIARCGHGDRLPREGDEPMVRFAFCGCEKYDPLRAASVSPAPVDLTFEQWQYDHLAKCGIEWESFAAFAEASAFARAAWDAARSTSAKSDERGLNLERTKNTRSCIPAPSAESRAFSDEEIDRAARAAAEVYSEWCEVHWEDYDEKQQTAMRRFVRAALEALFSAPEVPEEKPGCGDAAVHEAHVYYCPGVEK